MSLLHDNSCLNRSDAKGSKMKPQLTRHVRRCDGCALRRVRCEGTLPCRQCYERSLSCTYLRPYQKRGPKGRHAKTTLKVTLYQQSLAGETYDHVPTDSSTININSQFSPGRSNKEHIPLAAYRKALDVFHRQLFSVWPIISCTELLEDIASGDCSHEKWALAAAVGAATMAQMRLPEFMAEQQTVSAQRFEQETQFYRSSFDFREMESPASLLTSFFLHMFWANSGKFRLAEWYLREATTYAHRLNLHQPKPQKAMDEADRELQLRTYWVLYVTERTFCAQHHCRALLDPIDELPQLLAPDHHDSRPIPGLVALARSFRYLHKDILRIGGTNSDPQLTQDMISQMQNSLQNSDPHENEVNEVQKTDLVVTRNWLRTLLWSYTVTNFYVYCQPDDEAFSSFLPATIARDMLATLSSPKSTSLRAHGYGMELKTFKVADSLLDVLTCSIASGRSHNLSCDWRDLLHNLESILLTVGGPRSSFLTALRDRMAEALLSPPNGLLLAGRLGQDYSRIATNVVVEEEPPNEGYL